MEQDAPSAGGSRLPARGVKNALAPGLVLLALLVALTGCSPSPVPVTEAGSPAQGRAGPVGPHRLVFHGFSLNTRLGEGRGSSLSAKRLVVRRRTGGGGLLVYHDVRELVAEDAAITVSTSASGEVPLSRVLEGVKHLFASDHSGEPLLRVTSGNQRIGGRVVFEGLTIQVVRSEQTELRLAAKRGRFSFDSDTLLLDGQVVMTTALGEEVRSPRAAFSGDFQGVHLPLGYELGGERYASGALVVGDGGWLVPAADVPKLRAHDHLDRPERLVFEHLAKHVPAELQPLMLAILGQLTPPSAPEPQP